MAWTYSDWRTYPVGADRRARLALHLQELEDALATRGTAVGADGKSLSREGLMELIRMRSEDFDGMGGDGGSFGKIRRQRT